MHVYTHGGFFSGLKLSHVNRKYFIHSYSKHWELKMIKGMPKVIYYIGDQKSPTGIIWIIDQ